MMDDSLRLLVQNITKLPTLPVIAQRILNLMDNGLVSVDKLEEIISQDPTISAKILSFSNSAFFGYNVSTFDIKSAIMRIGYKNLKNIALGISLMSIFDEGEQHTSHYQRIFKHSTAVGMVAKFLSENLKVDVPDEIFISGLLHDLGHFVLTKYFPDKHAEIMEQVRKDVPLLEAEKATLGFSHAELGMWLADKWNLPDTVVNTILHHHTPSLASESSTQVAVVHLADYIATKSFLSVIEGEPRYPLDTSSFDILKISEKDFREIESRAGNEIAFNGVFE